MLLFRDAKCASTVHNTVVLVAVVPVNRPFNAIWHPLVGALVELERITQLPVNIRLGGSNHPLPAGWNVISCRQAIIGTATLNEILGSVIVQIFVRHLPIWM